MAFCLLPQLADKFKKAIVNGEIDINKLSNATSKERRAIFKSLMGEREAKEVNALFESKLLLKNQKRGLVNWAKQITGIKPEAKNTLIDKIQRMEKVLSPSEEKNFLQDLVSKRLGTDVSLDEASEIVKLSKRVTSLEGASDVAGRTKLGRAKMDLVEYVNSLNPKKANIVTNVANIPRALMTSLDLSAPLNQGFGMVSRKEFYKNLGSMLKAGASESKFKDIQAEILTRPSYKSARKAGLRITDLGQKLENREEIFMTNLLDRVPGVRGSQRAYTAFLNKLRMDVYDDLVRKASMAGEDVGAGSKVLEDIAKVVNNFTGGAQVGKFEQGASGLNALFFSPRKIKSTLEVLNPVNYIDPKISPTARKAATRNLLGSAAIAAFVIKLADLLGSEEPETDPRSSDFGKVRIGDTRVDVSGGNSGYINLIARFLTNSTKSSTSGVISPLGQGYGAKDRIETIIAFGRNKLSPLASLVWDISTGENAIGEPKTPSQSVIDRFKPMFINTTYELLKENPEQAALLLPALLGASVNTYSYSDNWSEKETQEMTQFKDKVGEKSFLEANTKYNDLVKERIGNLNKSLSNEQRADKVSEIKEKTKQEIFKEHGFKKRTLPKPKK